MVLIINIHFLYCLCMYDCVKDLSQLDKGIYLQLAFVESTHRHLETRVPQIHKHHSPGLLLGGGQVLLINAIRQ